MKKTSILLLFWALPATASIGFSSSTLSRHVNNQQVVFNCREDAAKTPAEHAENSLALFLSMYPNQMATTFLEQGLLYIKREEAPLSDDAKHFALLFDKTKDSEEMRALLEKTKKWVSEEYKLILSNPSSDRSSRLNAVGLLKNAIFEDYSKLSDIVTARAQLQSDPINISHGEALAVERQANKLGIVNNGQIDSSETAWLERLSFKNLCEIL